MQQSSETLNIKESPVKSFFNSISSSCTVVSRKPDSECFPQNKFFMRLNKHSHISYFVAHIVSLFNVLAGVAECHTQKKRLLYSAWSMRKLHSRIVYTTHTFRMTS